MKKFITFASSFAVVGLLITSLMIIQIGCEKNEENTPPACTITSPEDGAEIVRGEIITITVEAQDPDGKIDEVRFFIDEVSIGTTYSFPYSYEWDTADEALGNHSVKAQAIDDKYKGGTDKIAVTIVEN